MALPFFEQTPWPNWVIFIAVQFQSGRARMIPQTTEVLPIFRECPPTTTSIYFFRLESRESVASCCRYSRSGRAGVPHTGSPARTIFEVRIPGARANDGFRFDTCLIAHAHLPADDGVITDGNASREAGLRRNHHMPPNAAIVRDVDHIVQLGALPDDSDAERGTIDASVGADLHIVPDLDRTHLRDFMKSPASAISKPKPSAPMTAPE